MALQYLNETSILFSKQLRPALWKYLLDMYVKVMYSVCITVRGGDCVRLSITMSDDLVKKIDERAKSMYISRSAYIATALTQKMQADDALLMLPELSKVMKEAMDKVHSASIELPEVQ